MGFTIACLVALIISEERIAPNPARSATLASRLVGLFAAIARGARLTPSGLRTAATADRPLSLAEAGAYRKPR